MPAKFAEQVRSFYYRLIRKLEKYLNRVSFTFDKKDRTDTWIVLLCYWDLKKDNKLEETSPDFAKEFKDRILKQREALISTKNSVLQNSSDQLTIKLRPRSKVIEDLLKNNKLESDISVTIKTRKPISTLLRFPLEKYSNLIAQHFGIGSLRLYPHQMINHFGWGTDDQQTTVYFVYNQLGCPQEFTLDYDFVVENFSMYTTQNYSNQNLYYINNNNIIENHVPVPQPEGKFFKQYPPPPPQQNSLPMYLFNKPYIPVQSLEAYLSQNAYPYSSAPPWMNLVIPPNQGPPPTIPSEVQISKKVIENPFIMKTPPMKNNYSKKTQKKKKEKKSGNNDYELLDDIEADLGVLYELSLSNNSLLNQNSSHNLSPMQNDDIVIKNDFRRDIQNNHNNIDYSSGLETNKSFLTNGYEDGLLIVHNQDHGEIGNVQKLNMNNKKNGKKRKYQQTNLGNNYSFISEGEITQPIKRRKYNH